MPGGGVRRKRAGSSKPAGGGKKKPNKWMSHVAKVRKANPGKKFSEVLKLAAKSYKK